MMLALPAQPAAPPAATHVSSADIVATVKQMNPESVSDRQIRMVDAGGYHVGVGVVQRPASVKQGSIEHDKLTEVYYVLEGSGTLVTGGRQIDGKPIAPESATYRELTGPSATGTGINAGESRRIAPGDVVIIPQGVPHWFSSIEGTIKYLVVRVDPERLLQKK
jgi:Cupin